MERQRPAWIGFFLSVVVATLGALLGGLDQHWGHLFLVYLFCTIVIEWHGRRERARWWNWVTIPILLACSAYGLLWTVGFHRALTLNAILVYIGIIGATVFSDLIWRAQSTRSGAV